MQKKKQIQLTEEILRFEAKKKKWENSFVTLTHDARNRSCDFQKYRSQSCHRDIGIHINVGLSIYSQKIPKANTRMLKSIFHFGWRSHLHHSVYGNIVRTKLNISSFILSVSIRSHTFPSCRSIYFEKSSKHNSMYFVNRNTPTTYIVYAKIHIRQELIWFPLHGNDGC